jgi:hypothetical protein
MRYDSNSLDYWYIDSTVNDANAGDHTITLVEREGPASATANVTLLHHRAGQLVEAYKAVSGTVTITKAPSRPRPRANRWRVLSISDAGAPQWSAPTYGDICAL